MADRDLRIKMIFDALDKATGPMKSIGAGSKAMARELEKSTDELARLERVQKSMTSFRDLKKTSSETAQKLAEAKTRLKDLAQAIAATETPTRQMITAFNRAQREAAALKTKHNEQQAALQSLRSELMKSEVSTKNFTSEQKRLAGEMARVNSVVDDQRNRLAKASAHEAKLAAAKDKIAVNQERAENMASSGAMTMAVGTALAAPMLLAANNAATFESRMTTIAQRSSMTRAMAEQTALSVIKMAKGANQMPDAMIEGLDILTGLGMKAQDAVKLLPTFGKFATTYKAEMGDLANSTFASLDNLKIPIDQASQALGMMSAAGKRGAVEVKDMAQYFPGLTAAYAGLGQKGAPAVAQLAAALQITRKGAGDSASAANNLLNLLNKINSKDAIDNFKKMGVDLPAALKKAAKDGEEPIMAIARLTNQAMGGDLSKMSFLFADAQVQAALRPLIMNLQEYKSIKDQAFNEKDSALDKEFSQRMSDTVESINAAKVAGDSLAKTFGYQLKDVIGGVSDAFATVSTAVADFAARNPGLSKAVGITAMVLGGVLVVAGGLALAIAGILGPLAMLRYSFLLSGPAMMTVVKAFGFLKTAFMAVARVFLMNPIGLAITAIAVAAYLIYQNWGAVKAFFIDLWDGVKRAFSGFIDGAIMMLMNFTPMGLIYAHWTGISAWFGSLWEGVKAGFAASLSLIKMAVLAYLSPALLIYQNWSAITGWFSGLWGRVKGVFGSAMGGIKSTMISWATSLYSIGSNIVSGIINGITAAPKAVFYALKDLVFSGVQGIKDFLGIKSPSRVFMGIGGHMIDGMTIGIANASKAPAQQLTALSRTLVRAASGIALATRPAAGFAGTGTGGTTSLERLASDTPRLNSPSARKNSSGAVINYNVNINFEGPASAYDEQRIVLAVQRALEDAERERAARMRSAYRDDA
jgi:TP901 family phage tail tape measure protein